MNWLGIAFNIFSLGLRIYLIDEVFTRLSNWKQSFRLYKQWTLMKILTSFLSTKSTHFLLCVLCNCMYLRSFTRCKNWNLLCNFLGVNTKRHLPNVCFLVLNIIPSIITKHIFAYDMRVRWILEKIVKIYNFT